MGYRSEEQVAAKISELRDARGMSQRELADRLGLAPSAVNRIEHGQRGVGIGELATIANALDVPVESILREETAVSTKFRADEANPSVRGAMETVNELLTTYRYLDAVASPVRR
jgi:transcriptional regulator with XRE-family HTH domain